MENGRGPQHVFARERQELASPDCVNGPSLEQEVTGNMRIRFLLLFMMSTGLFLASTPLPSSNTASSLIYITDVTVIDTRSGKEDRDRTVMISGNRISEVRDSKDLKTPSGA
jgi:hypothetical protein